MISQDSVLLSIRVVALTCVVALGALALNAARYPATPTQLAEAEMQEIMTAAQASNYGPSEADTKQLDKILKFLMEQQPEQQSTDEVVPRTGMIDVQYLPRPIRGPVVIRPKPTDCSMGTLREGCNQSTPKEETTAFGCGIPPIAPIGCSVLCLDGRWQSLC